MMKRVILTLLVFVSVIVVKSQTDNTGGMNTLFGDDLEYGGYGAFSAGYTKLGDYNSFTGGMKGAWIINHSIGIGMAGSGFITNRLKDDLFNNNSFITGGYGGLLIEPIFYAKQSVHFSIPIIIGGGVVTYIREVEMPYNSFSSDIFDGFFVFEPGVELEINMVKFFRIAFGVSYRLTSDIDLSTEFTNKVAILEKDALNQIVAKVVFKFGKF